MALINITPVMTSNNTPTPYIVTTSSNQTGYEGYKAFNNQNELHTDAWATGNNLATGWIQLDFSALTKINAFSIYARNWDTSLNGDATECPKEFILYGSNDGGFYEQIKQVTNQIQWSKKEGRLYNLDFPVNYRYYKIQIISNNGKSTFTAIGEIKFYQDDGTTPVIENRKNSLKYTLPFGSKLRLDNLTSDLNYMLATENDGDNFGTLRVVNEAGKFEMAKAGQKIRKLWGGVATTVSTLILDDTIENYSSIILVANYSTGSGVIEGKTAQSYPVIESSGGANEFLITLSLYSGSTAKAPYIYFKMEGNQLNITAIGTGGFSQLPRLVSIYGVY